MLVEQYNCLIEITKRVIRSFAIMKCEPQFNRVVSFLVLVAGNLVGYIVKKYRNKKIKIY